MKSPKIREIAEEFIGGKPILKPARTYSIKKEDTRFPWHADNILPKGEYDDSLGIVCILYLVDDLKEGTFWVSNFKSWDLKKIKKFILQKNYLASGNHVKKFQKFNLKRRLIYF